MQAPPDVQIFNPFIKNLFSPDSTIVTARDYAETLGLLKNFGIQHQKIGDEKSKKLIDKAVHTVTRTFSLSAHTEPFEACLTLGNLHSIYVSRRRGKLCINFMDNELGLYGTVSKRTLFDWIVVKSQILLVDYVLIPSVFPKNPLILDGMSEDRIFTYDGYKEDIYIANYQPNEQTGEQIPFEKFVVIRPESYAIYKDHVESLVPKLIESMIKNDMNIVYLPRIQDDIDLIGKSLKTGHIYIPPHPLNGLDLCYYAQAVLSGSGTITREAACMGKTAISFFPGKNQLAVDASLITEGRLFYSRDPHDIVKYITDSGPGTVDFQRSNRVQQQVFATVKTILNRNGISEI